MLKSKLKVLRAGHSITQEQLAQAIGVERSSIGKYEGNQNIMPSVEILVSIADYFGVTTDYLLGRTRTYDQAQISVSDSLLVAEAGDTYAVSPFQRKEFTGLTQSEIDKLAIYAEGLKAGRSKD